MSNARSIGGVGDSVSHCVYPMLFMDLVYDGSQGMSPKGGSIFNCPA